MKDLSAIQVERVSGGNPAAWAVIGYVGGKVADVAIKKMKEDIQESRRRSREGSEGKKRVLTRRGYRWR